MTKPLWTSADIEAATGGKATAAFDVTDISIDTRSLQPGELFVALKDVRDGHDFVEGAFEAGASGALTSRQIDEHKQVVTHDVLEALEALGIAARARSSAIRAAVTGSVGKTSVKEMLAQIFRAAGPAHWSVKSFNNHWGVPLTLARMPEETERAIFEIGMSTPGEIAPRSKMVRPNLAMVTKIAGAHLEGLGTLEAVAQEKADIFAGLEMNGHAILPADDNFFMDLKERALLLCPSANILTFGETDGADAQIVSVDVSDDGTQVEINIQGETVNVSLAATGHHWAFNAACALLAATLTGISAQSACDALNGFGPPPGRGTVESLHLPNGGTVTLIDDSYNANPESMRAAMSALSRRTSDKRRILALGEMLEIGAQSNAAHAALATHVTELSPQAVFLAGANMKHLSDALPGTIQQHFAVKAIDWLDLLKSHLSDGDALLIKGSNASGMGTVANRLREWSAASQNVMERGAESNAGVTNAV